MHAQDHSTPSGRRRRARLAAWATAAAGLALPIVLAAAGAPAVTPTSGPSWLATMKRSLDRTALGRAGTLGQEATGAAPDTGRTLATVLQDGFTVSGPDLFRYNCRACHGAAGAGLPPEIQPLTTGILATSAAVQERIMARRGAVDVAEARRLSHLAEVALRHRLEEGGAAMPAFSHLGPEETEVLLAYLETVARIPDPHHRDAKLTRSAVAVGEQVVKGTCQICHDATPAATVGRLSDRQIPPLSALPKDYALGQFTEKARHGDPVALGRGRMPRLPYLTDGEIAAAYLYLAAYPPR